MMYLIRVLRQAAALHNEVANTLVDEMSIYAQPLYKHAPASLLTAYYQHREAAVALWSESNKLRKLGFIDIGC